MPQSAKALVPESKMCADPWKPHQGESSSTNRPPTHKLSCTRLVTHKHTGVAGDGNDDDNEEKPLGIKRKCGVGDIFGGRAFTQ